MSSATILSHLMKMGKPGSDADIREVHIVQKPLSRAFDSFFDGHAHDVKIASGEGMGFLLSKCWASQKKYINYD